MLANALTYGSPPHPCPPFHTLSDKNHSPSYSMYKPSQKHPQPHPHTHAHTLTPSPRNTPPLLPQHPPSLKLPHPQSSPIHANTHAHTHRLDDLEEGRLKVLRLPDIDQRKGPAPSQGMLMVTDSYSPRLHEFGDVYDWASTHLFLAQVRRCL